MPFSRPFQVFFGNSETMSRSTCAGGIGKHHQPCGLIGVRAGKQQLVALPGGCELVDFPFGEHLAAQRFDPHLEAARVAICGPGVDGEAVFLAAFHRNPAVTEIGNPVAVARGGDIQAEESAGC